MSTFYTDYASNELQNLKDKIESEKGHLCIIDTKIKQFKELIKPLNTNKKKIKASISRLENKLNKLVADMSGRYNPSNYYWIRTPKGKSFGIKKSNSPYYLKGGVFVDGPSNQGLASLEQPCIKGIGSLDYVYSHPSVKFAKNKRETMFQYKYNSKLHHPYINLLCFKDIYYDQQLKHWKLRQ